MPLKHTSFIPAEMYDRLTAGLAADMSALTPEVDGSTAHKVAEVLSRYGLYPDDMMKTIIDDMTDNTARQIEPGVPAITYPVALTSQKEAA